jgi:NADP-dependent 3-hydroxy acid dehydrogenase YdfG
VTDRPVALVTGASRGIGRAIAIALAPTHEIIAGARSREALDPLVAEVPGVRPWVVDLADPDALETALGDLPDVDVVVHSAGAYSRGPVESLGPDEWRRLFQLNVFSAVRLVQHSLPALRRVRGSIVLLNSGAGLFAYPSGSLYSATKHALKAFADTVRIEEAENGVRVTSVHPGRVATDLMRESIERFESGPWDPEALVRPEEVAAAVVLAVTARPEIAFEDIRVRPVAPSPVR